MRESELGKSVLSRILEKKQGTRFSRWILQGNIPGVLGEYKGGVGKGFGGG